MPERFCVYMRCLAQNCLLRRFSRRNRKLIELSGKALTRHPLLQQSILIKQAEKADRNAVCLYHLMLQLYLLDPTGMLLRFRIIVYTHQRHLTDIGVY